MAECLERPCETGYDLTGTRASIRQDLRRFVAWLGDLRVLLVGLLAVVLAVGLVAALGGRAANATHLPRAETTYSGDDLYDPAAGSVLALLSRTTGAVSLSGDDAYDPAAGARPELAFRAAASVVSLGGDDAYDPAAGGLPELFAGHGGIAYLSGDVAYDPAAGARPELAIRATVRSLSGDDVYDPAAGGLPELFVRSVRTVSLSGDATYDPATGARPELAFRRSPSVVSLSSVVTLGGDDAYDPAAGALPALFRFSGGGYSGDDVYDPAAGGTPK